MGLTIILPKTFLAAFVNGSKAMEKLKFNENSFVFLNFFSQCIKLCICMKNFFRIDCCIEKNLPKLNLINHHLLCILTKLRYDFINLLNDSNLKLLIVVKLKHSIRQPKIFNDLNVLCFVLK
jgi:hypothetical protein